MQVLYLCIILVHYVQVSEIFLGTNDVVFSVANSEKEIEMFTNALEAKLVVMEGGVHFLSFTPGKKLEKIILELTEKWMAKPNDEYVD